ncbi:MAG: type IV pilus assembly protein PilM [Planctomycetota bacterium]
MNWKRSLKFGIDTVLGLDIGSSAVKMVTLSKSNAGYSTSAVGFAEITASADNDSNPRANTIKAIRECFGQTAAKSKFAVCGVSGPDVAVRDFEFPPLSDEEIEAAVLLEAAQVCPFNAADSAVGYQVMPNGHDKTHGVLVAATNPLVQGKTELTRKAGLKCVLVDVDGLALLNCCNGLMQGQGNPSANQTIAILNVGASHTTLAVMDKNGWPFIRDMTYAGDDIVAQIAAQKGLTAEAVRQILSGDSTSDEPDIHDGLESACLTLINGVGETLRYYVAQSKSPSVDKLLVCGGFALARGFVGLLNSRLGTEAVLWNPFETIPCRASRRSQQVLAKAGPAMAVAAGLAMRSI